jgi:SnoaL-like domain
VITAMNPDPLQRLLDERDIERALYTSARAMDDHDWTAVAEVFADDAERLYTMGDYHDRWERRAGRWRIVERIKVNRAYVGTLERVFGD